MAVKAPSNVKNPVATPRGWLNGKGELVKAQKLTQAECDEFNGVVEAAPVVVEEVVVEEVVVEEVVVEEKPKRKARSKAKKSSSIISSALKKIKGE